MRDLMRWYLKIILNVITNHTISYKLTSLSSIRDWWVRYVTMWNTTLQQVFDEVSMLRSCIDKD